MARNIHIWRDPTWKTSSHLYSRHIPKVPQSETSFNSPPVWGALQIWGGKSPAGISWQWRLKFLPTLGETQGRCQGRPYRGAVDWRAFNGRHKARPYRDMPGPTGRGFAKLFRLDTCHQCRHSVGEACCRRGGVAGGNPPHKGGPTARPP